MERKNHKKTTLATLISVLLMGGAGATYANSASISEKLDLATQHLDGAASTGEAISSDGKTIATSINNRTRAFLLSGDNWATKTELGSLKSDSSGTSIVRALSADGKIAAGISSVDSSSTQLHATIWSGDNWATKTTLGTLATNNGGDSVVYALSADGKVAAGQTAASTGTLHAVIWSGDNWATKTDLGTIRSDGAGNSMVKALSADGKIAVGSADSDIKTPVNGMYAGGVLTGPNSVRAIAWSGDNWATKTDLGTLRSDNLGAAVANAISADGKVIGGASHHYVTTEYYRSNDDQLATIWSGGNWATKTNLGSLRSDNSGASLVAALSADGSIAGGAALNDANATRAIIWSGRHWATKTDLGTLKSDNSGNSEVAALSPDGSVAVGTAAADSGSSHATVWKITYPAESTSTSDSTTNTPTPSQPSVVTVDADNTKKTLSRLGAETFSVMDLQRQGLTRLQQHCQIDAAGQSCWAVQTAISSIDGNRDKVAGIKLGHGFTETFSAGLSLDRSLSRSLPDSYLKNNGNLGAGLYAQWNTAFHGSQWYVRPAVAFNRYNVTVQRPVLENTEAGIGTSRMKGRGASLETGQTFKSDHGVLLGWHLGGRYNNVSRAEYSEQNAAFPTTYGKASFKRTSAYLGADATIPLTTNLKWMAAAEIDRALKNRDAVYSAQADYIGSFNHRAGIKGTIATLSSGLQYTISEKILLGLTLDVNQTAFGDIARGGTFTVGGHF
ncbi:autotransporter [Xylella fastidiosa]|uniref:autotransporter domain-containing protein n=1 Tax=Xylella fastidiosa TaxID=2371 RepID=UPI0009001FB7|nr:autotransporter domain-containing protein [Xylella fastidiosa]MDD0929809.1 autotransporter domain-containing protein [Xylella fastidiosa subsp. multiplex]MDD0943067.1 autotransporter domain-containing protein [Xylella fastidiosa subsp. multiplex]QTX28471.1 autotransporter domain-containing protein [Xylella fastidiosa subsp. multiplex]QTX30477.1 autotransporter domain-containing protein [Xylella fastidiosa subsp. multiplex]TNV88893.1 autotransporter [Xylella fastidiosa]